MLLTGLDSGFGVITLSGIGFTLLHLHITDSHLSAVPAFQRITHGLSPESVVERVLPRRSNSGVVYSMKNERQP